MMMNRVNCFFVLLVSLAASLNAQSTCKTTPDDVQIAKAISAAAASGGGAVQLLGRVYDICRPIMLESNIHLTGKGRGATILRTRKGRYDPDNPNSHNGSVVAAGVTNASVTELTLDHRTNGRVGNGIVITDRPEIGAVSSKILITRNEVLGTPGGHHQYLIWNYRGRHVKILNNWIDGAFTGGKWVAQEEGIESFGGYDIIVIGNTITGINGSCLSFGSPDESPNPDSEVVGVMASDNYMSFCFAGINFGTGTNPPQTLAHVVIRNNVIIYAANVGISVSVGNGSLIRDLNIGGNTIRNVGVSATPPLASVAGVRLHLRSGTATMATTSIAGNHIDNVVGAPGVGIRIDNYQNARVRDNSISGTSDGGIVVWGDAEASSDNTEITGNRIGGGLTYGIFSGGLNRRLMVNDNTIANWGVSDGIHLEGTQYGVVRGNMFIRADTARPLPLYLGKGSCGIHVSGNLPLYVGSVNNNAPPPCP
jgi:hypothetical protein